VSKGTRLDVLLVERGYFTSRERAQAAVMSGAVYVDGQRADKPGTAVTDPDAALEVRRDPIGFVSRGGLKLQKALDTFGIPVEGLRCLDAGASTGGFTDCMLQRGAAHVWAVDVGYGQLAWTLRNDPRVTVLERQNIRQVTTELLGDTAQFFTADLSFISLRLVLPVLRALLDPGAEGLCLVKPQFEAGRGKVGKNGVVRDPTVHLEVLRRFCEDARDAGFAVKGMTCSPIKGPKGNVEFLAWLGSRASGEPDLEAAVREAQTL
jgi:23S rRNA (cytidine1920-2'-O)/16S rRNA (cytidine1409-2'-O)-methyltransferase